MGSVISIIGSAIAFSGTNYAFSKLSDHGAGERERHDKAIEKLQKDRNSWFKAYEPCQNNLSLKLLLYALITYVLFYELS